MDKNLFLKTFSELFPDKYDKIDEEWWEYPISTMLTKLRESYPREYDQVLDLVRDSKTPKE